MIAAVCISVWLDQPSPTTPDFGSRFYVDDSNNRYTDDTGHFYEDGEPT